jgi:hypothetical protein
MRRDCLTRLVFYRQIGEGAIGVNLDTNGPLIYPNARLRKARADERNTKSYSPDDAARR